MSSSESFNSWRESRLPDGLTVIPVQRTTIWAINKPKKEPTTTSFQWWTYWINLEIPMKEGTKNIKERNKRWRGFELNASPLVLPLTTPTYQNIINPLWKLSNIKIPSGKWDRRVSWWEWFHSFSNQWRVTLTLRSVN